MSLRGANLPVTPARYSRIAFDSMSACARCCSTGTRPKRLVREWLENASTRQLMQAATSSKDANRVQEVSDISRGLKALARELSVPVIALSQLSRQPEMRESREPRLSDLRESGAIEQDADLVLFLWREKERGAEEAESDGEIVNLKLAKHRNGPTGEVKLWFRKSQTRFVSYAGERYADVAG